MAKQPPKQGRDPKAQGPGPKAPIDTIAKHLRESRRVLFITGAGLSADSGLPTYRGVGGLYNDASGTDEGLPIEVALSGQMFLRRPELTWKYILQIEAACRGAGFNRGHEVIARLEETHDLQVLTQNVDGLHKAAGSTRVIDIHGDVHTLYCTSCRWREEVEDYTHLSALPRCPDCNAVIRPDVVLFDEMLDPSKLAILQRELTQGFDMVFTIGTTSVFPYIAMPIYAARHQGAPTVEINPGQTEVSHAVDYKIKAGAADTLSAIFDAL